MTGLPVVVSMSEHEDPVFAEALLRFNALAEKANGLGLREPMAAALATADREGRPSVRTVLVRKLDGKGIVFFTNSLSRKGRELTANPRAAICFYWDAIAEQVRMEGNVILVPDSENVDYWKGRPRDRQIGAWASNQSEILDSPEMLMNRYAEFERQFTERDVPRPEHWFGYRIEPDRIEFWSNRPSRLHERIVFERQVEGWVRYYLYP